MKCLRTIGGKVMPKRYHDNVAEQMVRSGEYKYCSKEDWKREVRDRKKDKKKKGSKLKDNSKQ